MTWAQQRTTANTLTLPTGAILREVRAESHAANGSISIFGGDAIVLDGAAAPCVFQTRFPEGDAIASGTGTGAQIITANTVSTWVAYSKAPGT